MTNRIVAFVPGDGDVVQGNAVVPEVDSYKRMKIGTSRIDAVAPALRGLAGQHGRARQEEEDRTRLSTGMKKRRGKRK